MTIIAAITKDYALGRGGDMIYHISADLKRFKSLTMGHSLVMGRRTFESFPNGPLPGRRNIVVSKQQGYMPLGAEVFPNLEAALEAAGPDAYVIGGGEIYRQTIDRVDTLEITEIDAVCPDADTFFPEIDAEIWREDSVSDWYVDPRSNVRYRFISYTRH